MLTPKQAAANAANAQLSTGPITPEGKARSSRNALKHGLTAGEVVVEPGREQEFHDYRDALLQDLGPQGATEMDIFNRLVHAGWTLQRIREIESGMMREGILDPLLDEAETRTLDRMLRYYSLYERIYNRSLKELRVLQTNRALRYLVPPEIVRHVPVLASVNDLTKRTQSAREILNRQIEDFLTAPASVQNEPASGLAIVEEIA
jgi:hypothetical protein